MTRWDAYITPLVAVLATALTGVLLTGRRLSRSASWTAARIQRAARWLWRNTRVVLWCALILGVGVNLIQSRRIAHEDRQTRAVLCLNRAEVQRKLTNNQFQLDYAHALNLSRQDIVELEAEVTAAKSVLVLLRGLDCA